MAYDDDDKQKARKKPPTPEGYDSDAEFLSEMRERYDIAVGADQQNLTAMREDIQFTFGEQWDARVRANRIRKRKPVLQINRIPAIIGQVVNNRLVNETEIRVLPEQDGRKEIAAVREGLIRSIFKNSLSDFARDEAMKYQVVGGLGWFAMNVKYTSDDVFEQDICIEPAANPFSVVIDELAVEPSGGDARWGWKIDDMGTKAFKRQYPWAQVSDFAADMAISQGGTTWFSDQVVKVVDYWRMVDGKKQTLVMMIDGSAKAVPHDQPEALQALLATDFVWRNPETGEPRTRVVTPKVAQVYKCSGADILEGPYTLNISSLPLYRVPGWEFRDGDRVVRWGLVRFMKDPMRNYNLWRSIIAEQLTAAPRNKILATKEAVEGREKEWRTAYLSDDPLMIYNAEGGKPDRLDPPSVDAALLTEIATAAQDLRDVTNIHEAALGQKSNEVSGAAIDRRMAQTDLGVHIYQDRLRLAEERCAKNINELLPYTYDSTRIVTVMGANSKEAQVVINDPLDPMTDISLGKYAVTVTTGPATVTKRQLAARQMETFINASPEVASEFMDLFAEAQDWPKSQEFVDRVKQRLAKMGLLPANEMTPEQQQAAQQEAEVQQAAMDLQRRKEEAEIANLEAEAMERKARAMKAMADAEAASMNADARVADVAAKNEERDFDARARMIELAKDLDDDGRDDRQQR